MNTALILIVVGLVVAVNACPVVVTSTSISRSCCEVKSVFKFASTPWKSRVYNIANFCGKYCAQGYCDADSGGGGWLVVQRRKDGSVDFNRSWIEYEDGFGDLDGEFWYGLHPLHCLTNQGQWQLRIDFTFSNGTKSFLFYDNFAVGSFTSQYQLSISKAIGANVDPFHDTKHPINGMKFTTKDRDNDLSSDNCALNGRDGKYAGGWWHKDCSLIHLNHVYSRVHIYLADRKTHHVPFVEMKIRPHKCAD